MQEQIFDMLLNEEEVSWRTIIVDLVKTEQMDPWNIDITLLTQKYIQVIKEMSEHDLKVSGKIVLAAAVLLRIKSTHLLDKDISNFDSMLNQDESLDELEDELFENVEGGLRRVREKYALIPRNPQPRNRKVSVHDLVNALQRAMASKKRILAKMKPVKYQMPDRHVDIMEVIRDVYHKVTYYSEKDKIKTIAFSRLLPSQPSRTDKVYTFLPLLHLENQHKIEMEQEKPFDEIQVGLKKRAKAK
jgi:segregation and condensation protein A